MVLALLSLLVGCSEDRIGSHDATAPDALPPDTLRDSGGTDFGPSDTGVPDSGGSDGAPSTIRLPRSNEWIDHGPIFSAGPVGAWDHYLYGGFGGTAVKKNNTFLLYYQGAEDYDTTYGTVTYRAIGVATSPDGMSFTKHGGNPVLVWFPTNSLEEGAASAGATLSSTGEVVIYYGANTAISATEVNGDGRVATSTDGLTFVDKGLVLDHNDSQLWGSGDEVFPVAALLHLGKWHAYYIPNGSPQKGLLGVAWGTSLAGLTSSAQVLAQGDVPAWGMAGHAMLDGATCALFISEVGNKTISAYTMDPQVPDKLTGPLETYSFSNMSQGTVFLDGDTGTWFMFYRDQGATAYGVRSAPVSYP
jgi:hypothetical protein